MSAPTGELTLAKGRRKVAFLATADEPADWSAITPTEYANFVDLTCSIARDNFALGFTDSDTVDDSPLCTTSNVKAFDASNFEAKFSLYRFIADDGTLGTKDSTWPILGKKNVTGWLIERVEPLALASVDWATDDKIVAYPVRTDNPQQPSDLTGYTKRVIPFVPNGDAIEGALASGT